MMNVKIELIPNLSLTPKDRSVKNRLEKLLIDCKSFMGCTAFWSIPIDFFAGNAMANAIKKNNSFFCADIQKPTNIDNIAEYVKAGATEVYLHKYREHPDDYTKNTNLLHSKILLFNFENEPSEIWLGSHNMTGRAINGNNLEASISIKCSQDDNIYKTIKKYLEDIRKDFCIKFKLDEIEGYKKAQMRDAWKELDGLNLYYTITLFGKEMGNLEEEVIIQLLSLEDVEFSKFKIIESKVYLHAYDIYSKESFLYECSVEQAGKLDESIDKLKLDFKEERRFSCVGILGMSRLGGKMKVTDGILEVCHYFVNIKIIRKIYNFKIFEKPSDNTFSFWQDDGNMNAYDQMCKESESMNKDLFNFQNTNKNNDKLKIQLINIEKFSIDKMHGFNIKSVFYDIDFESYEKLSKILLQEEDNAKKINDSEFRADINNFIKKYKQKSTKHHKILEERIIIDLDAPLS